MKSPVRKSVLLSVVLSTYLIQRISKTRFDTCLPLHKTETSWFPLPVYFLLQSKDSMMETCMLLAGVKSRRIGDLLKVLRMGERIIMKTRNSRIW